LRWKEKLLEIEEAQGGRILYAVESGSRAWGLASPDSDYDVRFIYAHPKNWYLNAPPQKDVIARPIAGGFDLSGWDLRKTFFPLARESYRRYLQGREAGIKNYFYAPPPALSCMWIEKRHGPPPMEFERLLTQIEAGELRDDIMELLAKKRAGLELGAESRIERIN
jgi:predicted nucleotidyltransferase